MSSIINKTTAIESLSESPTDSAVTATISSLDDLQNWVLEILPLIAKKKLILLNGPMGAGKTTFVHFLAKALGGEGASSPTFAFHQTYNLQTGKLHHFDLFRIKNEDDLESIGIWDHLNNIDELTLIEWPDRLDLNSFPNQNAVVQIDIEIVNESTRLYALKLCDSKVTLLY